MRQSSSHSLHYLKCAEAPPRGHDTETLQHFSMVDMHACALGSAIDPRVTQGCAARHVLVSRFLVMIHYETTSMCYFLWDFPWLSLYIQSEDPYLRPDVVGLPSEVI